MDDFAAAIEAAARDVGCKGIGTLGEKSLHLALKYYFAPDKASHEQPLGQFVADAVTEDGVIEVQTRGLHRLKRKLDAFLPLCPVTVVYPVAEEKLLVRVDENGEVLSQRKSPKHETVFTAMRELYALRDYVQRPGLRMCLAGVKLTEYSVQAGKRKRVKLDDDTIGQLDYADIVKVNLEVSGYTWNVDGRSGIKAYASILHVFVKPNPFADDLEDELDEVPFD